MKKSALTIGLFTLVMVLTSFTTPETNASKIVDNTTNYPIDGNGGQDTGGHRKADYTGDAPTISLTNKIVSIDGNGGQDTGGHRKAD